MAQSFVNQIGNIGAILSAIVAAVFFTMLLVTANTMAQSVRERTNELGVLKTLGFSNRGVLGLVLGESVLVTALGGLARHAARLVAGRPVRAGARPVPAGLSRAAAPRSCRPCVYMVALGVHRRRGAGVAGDAAAASSKRCGGSERP